MCDEVLARQMLPVTVSDCVGSMLLDWEAKLEKNNGQVEVEITCQLEEVAAEVISHVAFGRDHKEAKEVYLAQRELQFLAFSSIFNVFNLIPGFRYIFNICIFLFISSPPARSFKSTCNIQFH